MGNLEETRRLAPLVQIGYRIYRGEIAIPAPPPPPRKPPIQGFSEAAYREGLMREIEEDYSAPAGTLDFLKAGVHDGTLAPFTEDDCVIAVQILNTLLVTALQVQSRLGDGPQALEELEAEVPGLPGSLYGSLLGYYAYINR